MSLARPHLETPPVDRDRLAAAIEELIAEEQAGRRAQYAVEMCPIGIIVVEPDGKLQTASAAVHDLAMAEGGSLRGQHLGILMDPEIAARHGDGREGFLAEAFARRRDRAEITGPHCPWLLRSDGSTLPVSVTIAFPAGERRYAVGYITVRDEPEEPLER